MTTSLTLVTTASVPAHRLFALSLDVEEHVASMGPGRERAVGDRRSGTLGLGDVVTWRAWHLGVRWTMTARVVALDAPHSFSDEQVRGPFRSFRHVHRFEETTAGASMTDEVTLASPVLGVLAERWVLVPYLRRLLRRRAAHLVARAASLDGGGRPS